MTKSTDFTLQSSLLYCIASLFTALFLLVVYTRSGISQAQKNAYEFLWLDESSKLVLLLFKFLLPVHFSLSFSYRSFLWCNAAAAATLLMLGSSFIHTFRHGLYGQLVGSASHALLAFLQDSHQEASVVLSK